MDIDYFIKKFRSIPNALWTTGDLYNGWTHQHCAVGFCDNTELPSLMQLFDSAKLSVPRVNDGPFFLERTPKARILAALRYIKNL